MNGSRLLPSLARHCRPLAAPLAVAVSLLGVAGQAHAQQARPGETLGMRYLSWTGKTATTPAVSGAAPSSDGLRRPRETAPRPQLASAPAPALTPTLQPVGRPNRYSAGLSGSTGLTPAAAWTGAPILPPQRPTPIAAQAEPQPLAPATAAPAPVPVAASGDLDLQPSASLRRQDAYYAAPPVAQQAMQPTPQPAQHLAPVPAVPAAESPAHDPMAPRRDALIFRMAQPAASAQPQTAPASADQAAPAQMAAAAPVRQGQPPRQGARYYSVHRQAGQQPDPMVLPESIFIGGSTDLAEPPPVQTPARIVNGRAQAMVPNEDPSLP